MNLAKRIAQAKQPEPKQPEWLRRSLEQANGRRWVARKALDPGRPA